MALIFLLDKEIKEYIYYAVDLKNLPFDTMINAMIRFQKRESKEIRNLKVLEEYDDYDRILLTKYGKECIGIVAEYINKGVLKMGEDIIYNMYNIDNISDGTLNERVYKLDRSISLQVMSLLAHPFQLDTNYAKLELERIWNIHNDSKWKDYKTFIFKETYTNLKLKLRMYAEFFYDYVIESLPAYSLYTDFEFNINITIVVTFPHIGYERKGKVYEFSYEDYDILYIKLDESKEEEEDGATTEESYIYIRLEEEIKHINKIGHLLGEIEIPCILEMSEYEHTFHVTAGFVYCITRGLIVYDYNISNVSDLYYILMNDLRKTNLNVNEHFIGKDTRTRSEPTYKDLNVWLNENVT